MTEQEFEEEWDNFRRFIKSNGYGFDVERINEFKADSIDKYRLEEAKITLLEKLYEEIKNEASTANLKKQIDDLFNRIQSMKMKDKNYDEDDFEELLNTLNTLKQRKLRKGTVVDRVWDVMFESQSLCEDDWFTLAQKFDAHLERHQNKKNFVKEFLKNQNKISWGDLITELYDMNKDDVVEDLKRKTNLTKGFNNIIKEHKGRTKTSCSNMERTKFVELAILKSDIVEEKWRENNEKEFEYMKFNVPKNFKTISLEELFDNEDFIVVVNGIAGVGKSTLYEEIIHRWSHGCLWNGEKSQRLVPLLFSISCRTMNIKKFKTMNEFISHLLPNLNLNLLEDKKALLMIDGVDELNGIEELSLESTESNLKLLCDIIYDQGHRYFNKIIITSRPKIAFQLRTFCKQELKVRTKNIEISGFSSDSIELFVQNCFPNNQDTLGNIMRRIHGNSTMKAMASIPIFLKSYCDLFSEIVQTPSTMTEVLLYTILNFFQKSFKKNNQGRQQTNVSFKDLIEDEALINQVFSLAELSYKALTEKKVIFFHDDSGNLNLLEKVGFLTKVTDPFEGDVYQYRHLTFQEIFTALFIIHGNEEFQQSCFNKKNLRYTLPYVSGLEGILKQDETTILKTFVQKVTGKISRDSNVKMFVEESFSSNHSIYSLYYECQAENLELPSPNFINEKMSELSLTVEDMLLREFVAKFWDHTLSERIHHFSFSLSNLQKSDNLEQLARISWKSNKLTVKTDHDAGANWIRYFNHLSDQSNKNNNFKSVDLKFGWWENDVTDDCARFLWYVQELWMSGSTLAWLKYLVDRFEENKLLRITILHIEDEKVEVMGMIGKLCKYIPRIVIYHDLSDIMLTALYDNMETITSMDSLELNTNISDVEFGKFKNVIRLVLKDKSSEEENIKNGIDHIKNELSSMRESEERNLKFVELKYFEMKSDDFGNIFEEFVGEFGFATNVETSGNKLHIEL